MPSAVSFVDIPRGVVDDVRLDNTCGQALYGVNVYQQGAIKIVNSNATGYLDAGYYVGSIGTTNGAALIIRNNEASGNNRGAIVEDSFDNDVDIRVQDNDFHDNTIDGEGIPSGIFVHNSDHTLIERNKTNDNGVYGIHVGPAVATTTSSSTTSRPGTGPRTTSTRAPATAAPTTRSRCPSARRPRGRRLVRLPAHLLRAVGEAGRVARRLDGPGRPCERSRLYLPTTLEVIPSTFSVPLNFSFRLTSIRGNFSEGL